MFKKIFVYILFLLFILMMLFFTIHQFWIGNVFFDEIHPGYIYIIFFLVGIFSLIGYKKLKF